MNDLANFHGPVATLTAGTAMWDLRREEWQSAPAHSVVTFRRDGKLNTRDFHNADGSIQHSRWQYDNAGRLTAQESRRDEGPVNRSLYFYDDAGRHIRTTYIDEAGVGRDCEICTYDGGRLKTKIPGSS